MARYPQAAALGLLDSAYPVRGLDPWYASSGGGAAGLRAVERPGAPRPPPGAPSRASGSWSARLRQAADERVIRDADGSIVPGPRGRARRRRHGPGRGSEPDVLPGARCLGARRARRRPGSAACGSRCPVADVELHVQRARAATSPNGLYFAVGCLDYPQLFSLAATPAVRREQLSRACGSAPGAFTPFTPASGSRSAATRSPTRLPGLAAARPSPRSRPGVHAAARLGPAAHGRGRPGLADAASADAPRFVPDLGANSGSSRCATRCTWTRRGTRRC